MPKPPTLTTTVYTTASFIGFHAWPDAPDEVDYLRSQHRHKFGVRVEVGVRNYEDRQIEFHILNRLVQSRIYMLTPTLDGTGELQLGSQSCEAIATDILTFVQDHILGLSFVRVEVNEDGENGAIVEYRSHA